MQSSWATFVELITTPFSHPQLVWGIVPLYFGLLLSELTADKADFRTTLQTGFSFLWSGAQWLWPYFAPQASHADCIVGGEAAGGVGEQNVTAGVDVV